ncbi:TIGR04211 family SH3 domain-containing protein [Pseudomonas sp. DTU_2021_1001937_2_SI_NGA_ILE_001]|uniref:TIGR04211 family SH3 domain-containing protein n=1 Tax=Pseudomonas sp. DTU_2021_1001937_2_SI_NGA_ILE_001 TaxID=3077589 RepID=UPI0025E699F5|nr:TIGR04211 family SH3 domain-containing protein [Pseudomonas sp. DTU_2021_1001937_2_SI_NGA_ILE_001]WNW11176.1 TIGR04211 family SH3 domain-containing protein [Pseudomonas sp. DTU_2021_1001937_2_SI_NGA_ILE_001]
MPRHLSALLARVQTLNLSDSPRRCLKAGALLAALGLLLPQTLQAAENDRWVSDSLNTYVRSGPTDGHRIVGTLKSGQKVELLGTQGAYSQIRGEGGSVVWILTSDLQDEPGQFERLPQLKAEVAQLTDQLAKIDDTWKNRVQGMQETLDSRKALVDELEARNKALSEQLSKAQSELRDTQARLGVENQQALMSYMVYGGSIAGAGLLVGLILPAMTRRKKRNDGWV